MCNSYCNSCNYCVSQCTCTSNSTLVVPSSIPGTGCISTNYGRCIYYSGNNITTGITVTNGQTMDTVVNTIATAIANVTPADLSWNTFDYQCLRADGTLVSAGASDITTGQEFAEAVSIALCSLATAVDITPNITISGPCSTYFSGITPGTSTLVEILDDFVVKLCDLNALNSTAGVNTSCSAGTWTSVPASGSTLGTWINWIKTNVCSLVTTAQGRLTALETFQSDVETFVGDSSFSLIDNSTSCISGSGSDDLLTTIGLIKTKLCSIDSTVSGLPNFSAITLPWTSCAGLYPSYGATAGLVTQLTRIVNELSARTYSFNGADFTVAATSCGTTVSLASAGSPFTCADLGSCSVSNIGDVNSYTLGAGSTYNSTGLFWNSTNQKWSAKKFGMTSSNGSCAISYVDNDVSDTLTYDVQVSLSATIVSNGALATPVSLTIGSPSAGTTPITLEYNPASFAVPTNYNFTPNGAIGASVSPVYNDGGAFLGNGSVINMAGAYVITSALVANTPLLLGTVPAGATPSVNRAIMTYLSDNTTGAAAPIILTVNASSGQVFMTSIVGISAPASYHTVFLSGLSYVL